jgi:hypothetical protein
VVDNDGSHTDTPSHPAEASFSILVKKTAEKKHQREKKLRDPVETIDKSYAFIAEKVAGYHLGVFTFWTMPECPEHMRPTKTMERAMGIVIGIWMQMMQAMIADPGYRAALPGKRSGYSQKVTKPLRRLEAPVGQKAMVTKGDADPS